MELTRKKRIPELRVKLMTLELLNLAKNWYTYKELSQIIGLPVREITRYVNGYVLPSFDRAVAVKDTLQKIMSLESNVSGRIDFGTNRSFRYRAGPLTADTLLLEFIVQHIVKIFDDRDVNGVISTMSEALPLATLTAHRFGVRLAIAGSYQMPGVSQFIERSYSTSSVDPVKHLYIPREMAKRNDRFLVISDIMASGEKEMCANAMIEMIQSVGAKVAGFFTLISIGREWIASIQKESQCERIETVIQID
jgi:adenine/guanine phosphoribosyltransferase-like PRPP-binding protein